MPNLETILKDAGFPRVIVNELDYTDGDWVSIRFDEIERYDENIKAAIDAGAKVDQSDKGLILSI